MSSLRYQEEIKTFLVDDEELANHRLRKALQQYPAINIIGEAENGIQAIELINSLKPDLVFLDIQMPGLSGFEVLEQLTYNPMIVFVTAFDEYAIKAFEINSIDYLLKPVDNQRLSITIDRILQKEAEDLERLLRIKQLLIMSPVQEQISMIPVKVGSKINLISLADICFFEAKEKYVFIHTASENMLIDFSLSYLQERLPAEFLRVHRSFIINKMKIKEMQKFFKGTHLIVMNDIENTRIKTAYSYAESIRIKLLLS